MSGTRVQVKQPRSWLGSKVDPCLFIGSNSENSLQCMLMIARDLGSISKIIKLAEAKYIVESEWPEMKAEGKYMDQEASASKILYRCSAVVPRWTRLRHGQEMARSEHVARVTL